MAQVIITKFSDYIIDSVEYFIDEIKAGLEYRDLPGISNNRIEKIRVTKQHPLVSFMASVVNDSAPNQEDRVSRLLPAISVTPGNMPEDAFTIGKSVKTKTVDSTDITRYGELLAMTDKEIQSEVMISKNQIETIIGTYNQVSAGVLREESREWSKNEEINISVWSQSADEDILLGKVMDAIIADIGSGMLGNDSTMRNLKANTSKGLTNFNYGRVLFGSEYNLTFLNTYKLYNIYTEDVLSGHDFSGTFSTPGED